MFSIREVVVFLINALVRSESSSRWELLLANWVATPFQRAKAGRKAPTDSTGESGKE